ncbi:MAG: MATE family efflux transporter [Firmicutes bacterium]|nr:MATE family efflux transporter [Bacillota bacterium]
MLSIAFPIIIQNFISSFLNMIDTVMVGKLGETEIAAVGIANQYFFFFHMFMVGLGAGCGVFIAQFWGTKDIKNIRRILGIGLGSGLLVASVFMIVGYCFPTQVIAVFNRETSILALGSCYLQIVLASYLFTGINMIFNFALRSLGQTMMPMAISAAALAVNAFFNYVLIFGHLGAPALGVAGAAWATVIARVIETMLLVGMIYYRKGILAASWHDLTDFTFGFVRDAYQTIGPVIFNDICWGLASLVYSMVYGRMGTQAVASIQICNTINNLFLVILFGLSNAAAVMIGNSVGAGKAELAKGYAKNFVRLSVLVGIGLGLLLALTSPFILRVFNVSSQVRQDTLLILYIIASIFTVRVLGIMIIVGILRGGGDARYAFLSEGFTMWFIGVPLTILGAVVFKFPVYLVYGLATIEEVAKCCLGLFRLKSGRWIRNVTYSLG